MFGSNSCMNFELASPVILTILVFCRTGNPFQGPRVGSCRTFQNEMSEETHVLTKQETLLRRGTWVKSRGKGAQENCSGSQSQAL